jgi:carbon-monoxide dehydrogenase medium subunit
MKPPVFAYVAADHLEQALELKQQYGSDARFLAGGQSLVPAMNYRLVEPKVLIDINRVGGLAGITCKPDAARIGAMTRLATLQADAHLARSFPLLTEACTHVAHPQVRNRGTLGGNLCQADPASELPAVLLALDARVRAGTLRGERWIGVAEFHRGIYETAIDDTELVTEIAIPQLPLEARTCFMEAARRRGDFAMMGVAVVIAADGDGRCWSARIALCNAGPAPVLAKEAASELVGQVLSAQTIDIAARTVASEIDPPGSLQASPDFQRHLAHVLTRRSLAKAAGVVL